MPEDSAQGHADRSHCLFGGSTAKQWVNCPASAVYRASMPPEAPSEYAQEGTKAHEAAEMLLEDFLAHKQTGSDPDIRAELLLDLDDAMREAVYGYRDTVWQEVLKYSVTGKAYGFEEKFMLSRELDIGGPCDFWCVGLDDRGRRYGYIVDFKYGYVEVEAKGNLQLALYACGLLKEIRNHGKNLDYINAAIYQPRAEGEKFKTTTFTAAQLDRYEAKFMKAAKAIMCVNGKPPKHKTGEWCTYCPAQARCPAYEKLIDEKMALALIDAKQDIKKVPLPSEIPDDRLVDIILSDDAITSFLKECRHYALNRAKAGRPLPGLKVVTTKPRRKWKEDDQEISKILFERGIKEPYARKLKPLTDIERQLKKLHPQNVVEAIMEPLCDETKTTEILVPVSDPRPGIKSYDDLLGVEDIKL